MSTPNMSGRTDDAPTPDNHLDATDLLDDDGHVNISQVRSLANAENGGSTSIAPSVCQAFRERIASGDASPNDLADEYDTTGSTVRRHAKGKCHHTRGDIPPLDRGWYETNRDPDTTAGANGYVTAKQCGRIRRGLLDGGTTAGLAEELNVSRKVVERHGNGTCDHGHTDPAPLAFGWYVPPARADE